MKKLTSLLCVVLSVTMICGVALAGNGNQLPSGPRYVLNVIAFDNCPAGDFTDSNRHMIAVKANYTADGTGDLTSTQAGTWYREMVKTNAIALTVTPEADGTVFRVIDGNACSKGGAQFMLPANPYDCNTGIANDPACINEDLTFQEYNVFIRLVGKPNTGVGVTTCATEDLYNEDTDQIEPMIVCSTENVVKIRATGKGAMSFDNVSKELLTVCLDTLVDGNSDGQCDVRYALFDPALENYFWQWNTQGKAHAQLVFMPVPD